MTFMMTTKRYLAIKQKLISQGYQDQIKWAEEVGPPANADSFAREAIYVICNSGMKWEIARKIYGRVIEALLAGKSASTKFGHQGKSKAIDTIWRTQVDLFSAFLDARNKVEFCGGLPWVGPITKYHLARNLGVDCAKPDRHLERIATAAGTTTHELCKRLAEESGDRVGVVDTVLWRAAESGLIDTLKLSKGSA